MKEKKDRTGQNGERGEAFRESTATHFARKFTGQPNKDGAGQRGQEPKADQGITEKVTREPGDQSDERRLIDVTPIEML